MFFCGRVNNFEYLISISESLISFKIDAALSYGAIFEILNVWNVTQFDPDIQMTIWSDNS